jgi:N-acetylmuramoyl-L-alanine amidase
VVLHATADRGGELSAESWMCNPAAGVSAHLHFRRDGTIVRLVPDSRRAWHAGRSWWKDLPSVNDFSLGWEIANRNDCVELYTDAQYESVAKAAAHYIRQGMPLEAFVSHASVARPRGRKSDPCGFDWQRFRIGARKSSDKGGSRQDV